MEIIAGLAVAFGGVWFMATREDSPEPQKAEAPQVKQAAPAPISTEYKPRKEIDYSKPIYTGRDAVICPLDIFFDRRADHGPEAVNDAALSLFHRTEKLEALGCQVWHEGIRLYIDPSNEGREWQQFMLTPDGGGEGLLAMVYYLTNDPGAL